MQWYQRRYFFFFFFFFFFGPQKKGEKKVMPNCCLLQQPGGSSTHRTDRHSDGNGIRRIPSQLHNCIQMDARYWYLCIIHESNVTINMLLRDQLWNCFIK